MLSQRHDALASLGSRCVLVIVAVKKPADAILDRLVHSAHCIDLAGESLRRQRSRSIPKD
jgi:hypothetical protein